MSSEKLFLLSSRGGVKIFEGFYKETLANIPPAQKYALVHLDCDLYSSTSEVLHALFRGHHLSEGAVLLFDDWQTNLASPEFGMKRAFSEAVEEYGVRYSTVGDYALVSHQIIFHSQA